MRRRYLVLVLLLGLCGGLGVLFAATVSAQTHIIYVNAQRIDPPDGARVYDAYCASCHGVAGRGNGPAAARLDKPVANLTLIAERDGDFDRQHVMSHVSGGYVTPPMPRWHQIIRDTYKSDGAEQLVIRNVTLYVETMQVKP
jgi:mono/diheme cytochrome c family protein